MSRLGNKEYCSYKKLKVCVCVRLPGKLNYGQRWFEGAEVKQKKCDEKTAQHMYQA